MTTETASNSSERTRNALEAAHLYYIQNLTMGTIASKLDTSRSSVSRLLSFARDTGLVEIQIRPPPDRASELQTRIAERYSVAAHIAPVPDRTSAADRLERVAILAARLLPQYFDSNMTLGIAWGSTMNAVSRHLVPKSTHNSVIVQLNGAGNNQTSGIGYVSEILRRFGDAFGANVEQFAVPAFFDNPATKLAFWQERSTVRVLELQQNVDVALFGLGSPLAQVPSHVFMGGYLDSADYATFSKDGIVGDVATVFYRADGSSHGIALNQRGSGPDLATLRRAARRVGVVSGISKLQSLRGALAAGAMTDLICDEGTARALVKDHA